MTVDESSVSALMFNTQQQSQPQGAQAMSTAIRPSKSTHRAAFRDLDADDKQAARAKVTALVESGTSLTDAWASALGLVEQPAVEQQPAAVEPVAEPVASTPTRGARTISTKGGKLPDIVRTALGTLKSSIDDKGELTIVRGEQQRVVKALRTYLNDNDVKDHVTWAIESIIGKVRAVFRDVDDDGVSVNVRAVDAMIAAGVMFDVVMRSDGSATYKVDDVVMSARDAVKRYSAASVAA